MAALLTLPYSLPSSRTTEGAERSERPSSRASFPSELLNCLNDAFTLVPHSDVPLIFAFSMRLHPLHPPILPVGL